MSGRKSHNEDTLRPHYDLDKLEVVRYGPGWASRGRKKLSRQPYYTSRITTTPALLASRGIDRELLLNFFVTFARAEYALKRAGYTKAIEGRPTILWEKFARDIADALLASNEPEIKNAIKYLEKNPPAQQIVKGGVLSWRARKPEQPQDPVFLMRSITTVRNNLFHGGKDVRGTLAERDLLLILHSLNLLTFAVSVHQEVLHWFKEVPLEAGAA